MCLAVVDSNFRSFTIKTYQSPSEFLSVQIRLKKQGVPHREREDRPAQGHVHCSSRKLIFDYAVEHLNVNKEVQTTLFFSYSKKINGVARIKNGHLNRFPKARTSIA